MLSCVSPPVSVLIKKLFSSLNDPRMARNLVRRKGVERDPLYRDPFKEEIFYRILWDGDNIRYAPEEEEDIGGVYIAALPLTPIRKYFEIEIVDTGLDGMISLGLGPKEFPQISQPGWTNDSVGYHIRNGRLYKAQQIVEIPVGPPCNCGDRVGCGLRFEHFRSSPDSSYSASVGVYFTHNGKEFGSTEVNVPKGGLFPLVGLCSMGAEVRLIRSPCPCILPDDSLMSVDSCEEEWSRLHDVRVNGQVLEYAGRGKSIIDVGLAQARVALTTYCHYFEMEILDPGENCYIAIGLARKDYPPHRHPGWNKGSVAYHADDGKIFVGSGVGDPFGPCCHKGDRMGCGILFPLDYIGQSDSDSDSPEPGPGGLSTAESSDSEDDGWWDQKNAVESGRKVQVFFTRNGQTVGKKEVRIPKGGFYPTIGMLSVDEKVRVDLHPLTDNVT